MSKSLVKNSIANVFYKSLNVIFPLITATYVSRVLLVSGVGKVSYAQNIVSYFVMFATLGMPSYGTREIAKLKNKNKNTLFTELFTINAISTILFSVAYFILIHSVGMFTAQIKLYYAVGIQLLMNVFNIDWYYQGEEEYGYIAMRGFCIKVISVFCIFAFVRSAEDYVVYALITALGTVGNYILNVIHLQGRIHLSLKEAKLSRHMKSLMLLTASSVAIELYTAIDTTMIGIMCTDVEVGYYSNAIKLIKLLQSVISALGAILLPRLSYYYIDGRRDEFNRLVDKALKTMLVLALPTALGTFCVADLLIPFLFGESFMGSIGTLMILSLTLPILVINVLFGIQVLITVGEEKQYLITVCSGAVTNIFLNPIFIILYKQDGAAFASLISESVVAISTILFARKVVRLKLDKKYIQSLVIALLSMVILVCLTKQIPVLDNTKLMISVIVGVMSYFGIILALKNTTAQEVYNIIIKRILKKVIKRK